MLALLATLLLVAVVFFLTEVINAYKFAPRYPSGAMTFAGPVHEPIGWWWATHRVIASGAFVLVVYFALLMVSL